MKFHYLMNSPYNSYNSFFRSWIEKFPSTQQNGRFWFFARSIWFECRWSHKRSHVSQEFWSRMAPTQCRRWHWNGRKGTFLSSGFTIFEDRADSNDDRWPLLTYLLRFWQKQRNSASTLSRTDQIIPTESGSLSTSVSLLTLVDKRPLMLAVLVTHQLVLLATIQILVQIT